MDSGTVAAVLSALGLGGLAGAFYRGEHERTERMRERMVVLADEFLRAVSRAEAAVDAAHRKLGDFTSAGNAGDSDRRTEAGRETRDAIAAAEAAIGEVEALVPRVAITFPANTVGYRSVDLAHGVVRPLLRACGLLSFGLSNPPFQKQQYEDSLRDFEYAYGGFAAYVNDAIWRRWLTRRRPLVRAREMMRRVTGGRDRALRDEARRETEASDPATTPP